MVGNIEGCQNTQLKQQMPDGLLCGQGKPDLIKQHCLLLKGSDQFRKNNLSKFTRVTNCHKMASVNNIFKWHEILVPSELQHDREFHSYESQHLRAGEVHLHAGSWSHSWKDK